MDYFLVIIGNEILFIFHVAVCVVCVCGSVQSVSGVEREHQWSERLTDGKSHDSVFVMSDAVQTRESTYYAPSRMLRLYT